MAAQIDGPLAVGSRLDLQLRHPRGRDLYSRPVITAVEHGASIAWESRGLGVRAPLISTIVAERDATRLTVELDATGRLAMTYRMTLSEEHQEQLWADVLRCLTLSFAGGPGT